LSVADDVTHRHSIEKDLVYGIASPYQQVKQVLDVEVVLGSFG